MPCFFANSQGTSYVASKWRQLSTCMPSFNMPGLPCVTTVGAGEDNHTADAGPGIAECGLQRWGGSRRWKFRPGRLLPLRDAFPLPAHRAPGTKRHPHPFPLRGRDEAANENAVDGDGVCAARIAFSENGHCSLLREKSRSVSPTLNLMSVVTYLPSNFVFASSAYEMQQVGTRYS